MPLFAGEYPAMTKVFVEERDVYLSYTLHAAAEAVPVSIPGSLRQHFCLPSSPRREARDAAEGVQQASSSAADKRVVVGVVGMGHVRGIQDHWGRVGPEDARRVVVLPRPSRAGKAFWYAAKLSFYSAVLFGAYKLVAGRVGTGAGNAWLPVAK